jgi:hypothetical protein
MGSFKQKQTFISVMLNVVLLAFGMVKSPLCRDNNWLFLGCVTSQEPPHMLVDSPHY